MSVQKQQVLAEFGDHVSSGKLAFFQKYGMDFVMGERHGPWLEDLDKEKKLFNLHCNGGVFNLGHRNSRVIKTLQSALDELDIGNHHLMSRERASLARDLAQCLPGDLEVVIFGVGGGEAVDLALQVARGQSGRSRILSATGGYHGHTGLALAAGDAAYRQPFGIELPGFQQVPFNDLDALRQALDKETAAVILETVPATLGMVIPQADYLQQVRQLCTENGTLLIMDEVQSGLGRTGKLWAFEHFGIIPDMVVIGKGLSGGIYPISATILRKPLNRIFEEDPFLHISTFGGAELGCRVAREVLKMSADAGFLQQVNAMAAQCREMVGRLQAKFPRFLVEFRQLGLMMGLVLKDAEAGPILTKTAYDEDLLLVYANNDTRVCQFLPPLTLQDSDLLWIEKRLDRALARARKLLPVSKVVRGSSKWVQRLRKGRSS